MPPTSLRRGVNPGEGDTCDAWPAVSLMLAVPFGRRPTVLPTAPHAPKAMRPRNGGRTSHEATMKKKRFDATMRKLFNPSWPRGWSSSASPFRTPARPR